MSQPRIIAFEGVDGAGKSTALELVVDHLRRQGTTVVTPRMGKEHKSKPIREIRRVTRDRTNLDICPRTELLLYAAREAQVLEQNVKPALAQGATVVLDRSMLTPIILGAHGRGLELESCEAIAAQASEDLWPDLTIVFDVDPRTSRIRKRLDKIRKRRLRDGGRKGLAGSGFKERIRSGYVELATRDDLPIIHAERGTPQDIAARVITLIETGEVRETPEDAVPWWMVDPAVSFEDALESLPDMVKLYFGRRLPEGRALRASLLEREPQLAIWAADFEDPLLERAWEVAPDLVIERLTGSPRMDELIPRRHQFAAQHPVEVARSLARVDGEDADALRTRLAELAPGAVVESLAGRTDAFAEALRDRHWKQATSYERAGSLRMCDDPASWRRRERLLEKDPAVCIPSLAGLAGPRIDAILDDFAGRAPKSVLQVLTGRSDAHAHSLRRALLDTGREAIDSLIGLDDPDAWALREDCVERWPATVVHSLDGLEADPRAARLIERCREQAPGDLFLTRRLYRYARRAQQTPGLGRS